MSNYVRLSTEEKALRINLDPSIYGCFGEIGAGQEVAANFFRAGGSSGTIAYSMSAYDMKISDSLYGEADRYVCEGRLMTMLDKEFNMLQDRLPEKAKQSKLFAFANTVESLNYHKTNQGQGWVGLQFQVRPNSEPNHCVIHVQMHDNGHRWQQEALGILGVNMIYSCFYHHDDPEYLMKSLVDRLKRDRIEIDMFRLRGPDFRDVDNRLMSLKLVKLGMTDATLFDPVGEVLQPSFEFYKKNVLVFRGRFRPATLVHMDILKQGLARFVSEEDVDEAKTQVVYELNLKDLSNEGEIDEKDFLDRVDLLRSLGHTVLVSNYVKYYRVSYYLSQFTRNHKIGLILGYHSFQEIIEEKYYDNLRGGILEAFGLGFGSNSKIYVYPAKDSNGEMLTLDSLEVAQNVRGLVSYMKDNNKLEGIETSDSDLLNISSDTVLEMIRTGDDTWYQMVPELIKNAIIEQKLFKILEA